MPIKMINMTPHPVTVVRRITAEQYAEGCKYARVGEDDPRPARIVGGETQYRRTEDAYESVTVFPACPPEHLPRAVEQPTPPQLSILTFDDSQGSYENICSLKSSGLVDNVAYVGVEALPELTPGEVALGCTTFRIVSIVTALGAIAAGRPVCDLLIPMGQVRDAQGRIIGATGLAPADVVLRPMATAIAERASAGYREGLRSLREAAFDQTPAGITAKSI